MKIIFTIVLCIFCFFAHSLNLYCQSDEDCMECHSDPDISMEKKGVNRPLTVKKFVLARSVHASLKCVDCHAGFDPYDIPHKSPMTLINCLDCHKNTVQIHRFHPQMVGSKGTEGSPNVNCKGCHGTHDVSSPKDPTSPKHFANSTQYCGKCHADILADHLQSEHHVEVEHNNPNAPTCIYCHSRPITKGNLIDKVQLKINQEKLCLDCHLNDPHNPSKFAKTLVDYEKSVHGLAILSGNSDAAVCVDCHGAHKLQKASVPTSSVHKNNIAELCGKCHGDITKEYIHSVHGRAIKFGVGESPTCTFCHGEHNITAVPHIEKQVFTETGMKFDVMVDNQMVWCISCHSDKAMMTRRGLLTIEEAHKWLPAAPTHYNTVRCVDCHSSYDPPNLSHNILNREETINKCEECHSQNSVLMSKLYVHEKEKSRNQLGFVNGTLLSNAYVIGTTRNIYLDVTSGIIFVFTVFGIFIHGFLRFRSRKTRNVEQA
ncbi:MAG: hypothetical protein CVV22_08330 [Ignavibacteriae bacterium HGW-Ignavibacteriae-1]|nr:MAG: hypothetical protein CVV22_08330 [Ignavibacteriae bacterium HGW-Ignavibacteriae-1]